MPKGGKYEPKLNETRNCWRCRERERERERERGYSKPIRKENFHEGVTIIALVITIIVMIILAGITIGLILSNDGIVEQALSAKDEYEIAADNENLQMLYMESEGKDGYKDDEIDRYLNYLEEKGISTKQEEGKYYVESSGRIYEVSIEDGDLYVDYVEKGIITNPRIEKIEIINKTRSSITIKTTAYRMEEGTYYYSIAETENNFSKVDGSNQTGEYTFSNLEAGKLYYIKVKGENKEGQTTEAIISTKMESIPDATSSNMQYTINWSGGTATVTITTNQNKYSIETSLDNSSYQKGSTRTGIRSGTTIYARLTDGNYSGKEMEIYVVDGNPPEVNVRQTGVSTKSISIAVGATDKETGMPASPNYKYYITDSADDYPSKPEATNSEGIYTFDELEQNTVYYIKVETEDRAGNTGEATIRVQTELIPGAEQGIKRETKWNTDGTAQITLSTTTGFKILYSYNKQDWTTYLNSLQVNNGTTVYIALTDERNRGELYELKIEDYTGPEVSLERVSTSSNTITVRVKAQDSGAGMPGTTKYNYYIKAGEEDYRLVGDSIEETEYTFSSLNSQTTYNIKVTVADLIGNVGEGTIEATTEELTYIYGNISFGNPIWENKRANVTMTNTTNYFMQYQIIPENGEIDLNGAWTTSQDKTVTVGNLKDGYRVIGRLYDGTNVTTGYGVCMIEDNIEPRITVNGISNEWTKNNVILSIEASDSESGLPEECYSFDGGITWQAQSTKIYEQNQEGIVIKVRDEAGNVATYTTLSISNIDKTGPAVEIKTEGTSSSVKIQVLSVTDAGAGVEDIPYFTYSIATSREELDNMTGEKSQEKEKSFTGLTQNTTYYVKVETQDKLGNITQIYQTVVTGSLDTEENELMIGEVSWENKKAKVIISNTSTYNMEYQIIKEGEIFNPEGAWTKSEEEQTIITNLLHNDTIYARLTDGINVGATINKKVVDETSPSINVTGNSVEWTKNNVILSIEASDSESGLPEECYSFDGGITWQAQNTKTYEQNQTGIVIKVRDEAGNIATNEVIDIDKIDKTGPNVLLEETENTKTNQIEVKVMASDAGSGLIENPIYQYFIKEATAENYSEAVESINTSYSFTNLKAGTKYTIKVEVKDKLENIGTQEIEITTRSLLYATGDITFSQIIWSNGIATVTAKNNKTDYEMQYQIAKNGAEINVAGKWITIQEVEKEIGNLENKDMIYARLTDGINVTTGYATCNISNPAKQTYTEEELAKETTRENYDILGIGVENNEIRVQVAEEQTGAYLYNYYYKNINEEEYTLISTCTYANDPAVITDVQEGATYKIKVLVMDEKKEVTRCKNTATVITLGQAEKGQTYAENRTYIDNSKEIEVRTTAGTGNAGNGETITVLAGYTVSLPKSFKISEIEGEEKQEQGIVLKDSTNNEYVWIPVDDALYDGTTALPTGTGNAGSITYKPLAMKQSLANSYYEHMAYQYNGELSYRNSSNTGIGKSGYREPSLITNNNADGYTWDAANVIGSGYDANSSYYKDILGFESASELGKYLASSYNNMITSVESYGGFYVGRYETTEENIDGAVVVGSKANSKVLSEKNWYQMNLYQDSNRYAENPWNKIDSVSSTMIWGSQWDAMLNYILTGENKDKVTVKIGQRKNAPSNSAQDETDIINNIYDLGSNVYEWTQEANSYNYRIYRGGSYDSSAPGTAAYKGNGEPTDQGPVFGSRLGLYIQSTSDVTGPAIKINTIKANTNSITVGVTATDKESGVDKYNYYISSNGIDWTLKAESDSNTYTYTGLLQNTAYYVKVEARDGAGNIGETEATQKSTTDLGSVAATSIQRIQKYGPDGEGIVELQLAESYTKQGYYIEYQIVPEGQNVNLEADWIEGNLIKNLSNGQTIYARMSDGNNRSSDYYEEVVQELEEYAYYTDTETGKSSATDTVKYTYDGQTAYIPAGFKVGVTNTVKTIEEGLVIQDDNGNQYVWVPVKNVIETDTAVGSVEKAMARYQTGTSAETERKDFEGIAYNYSGVLSTKRSAKNVLGTNDYVEPRLVTGGADYTWKIGKGENIGQGYDILDLYYQYMDFGKNSGLNVFNSYTEFGEYMNQEYKNMLQSVQKYGGFYIGRYETSLEGSVGNKNAVAQSKIGKTPIYNQNWYRDYYYQDSNLNSVNPYYNSSSVTSSMIWGSQWDAVMNWMLQSDKTKDFVTKVTGNHTEEVAITGSYANDLAKNIFDMSSNVAEWTQEAKGTTYRTYRGGYCVTESDRQFGVLGANTRIDIWQPPTMTTVYVLRADGKQEQKNYLGTRMTLYIKNTEDETVPEVEIESTEKGTNQITVKVNASDEESGIQKYKYSIGYQSFEEDSVQAIQEIESYGESYTFEGLTQNTTYYVKVEVINGAGKVASCYSEGIKTDVLEVQEGVIIKEKVYGKDGEGTAYFTINAESNFEAEGYYLEHQVDKTGAGYKPDGNWTKGDTIGKLSVGDVVYTRLSDGVNLPEYYMVTNITELETFSELYTTTEIYEDYGTKVYEDGTEEEVLEGTAYIPAGFRVATASMTKKIKNGLVIEDKDGNQYVWIPVKNVIYDGKTAFNTQGYKPMARYQTGYSATSKDQFLEGILYNYTGVNSTVQSSLNKLGTSAQREPSLITNSTVNYSWVFSAGNDYDATNYNKLKELGITNATNMGEYMNNQYTEMIQSVEKYGGFYVGRYETSLFTEEGSNSTAGTIVKSISEETPMASVDWYKMYLCEDSNYAANPYYTSSSVNSTMIWGSQWDAMLNYILEGTDKEKVTAVTGNHTNTRSKTGQFANDIMNNIFDLSSNVREWTIEANGAAYRTLRGGYYNATDLNPASTRSHSFPTSAGNLFGSRLSLYLK